jgi:hypothetical protein
MKTGQYYKVKATVEHIQNARPGCPVFEDDEDDDIIGFIDFVSDASLYIWLFDSSDLEFDCDVIYEAVPATMWQARLHEIVEEDDEIYAFWLSVFGSTEEDL